MGNLSFSVVIRATLFTLFCFFSLANNAQQSVLAYYTFGKSGNITYASLPPLVADASGNNHKLELDGTALFFADAPGNKKLNGEGAALFKGKGFFRTQKPIGVASENFIIETWVKATTPDNNDSHLGTNFPVVAWGDLAKGYVIAQRGSNWIIVVNGRATIIAPVSVNAWVHLALIKEGKNLSAYFNGTKKNRLMAAGNQPSVLSLAGTINGPSFNGMIYLARLSSYTTRFDAAKHLLSFEGTNSVARQSQSHRRAALVDRLATTAGVVLVDSLKPNPVNEDWLIRKMSEPVTLQLQKHQGGESGLLMLSNGLVSRTFLVAGNVGCISFKNLATNAEYLRAVKPEARMMLDSNWYDIGGLTGQPEKAYLMDSWYNDLVADLNAFTFTGITVTKPEPRYPWQQKFNAVAADWPLKGLQVVMHYSPPQALEQVLVEIHYEMYQSLPLVRKWMRLVNKSSRRLIVDRMECEILAVAQDQRDRLYAESDYSFAAVNNTVTASGSTLYPSKDNANPARFGGGTSHWKVDEEYNTWATLNPAEDLFMSNPHFNLLISAPEFGPAQPVASGEHFESFSTFELLHDSDDRERKGLAHRRMYRSLAPQVTESLLTAGITSDNPVKLKGFIDQMSELGFERLDIMAWVGISHDNLDPAYVSLWKEVAEYAKTKNIITGGYELQVASRSRGAEFDCIDHRTGKPGSFFGQSVCIASQWQDEYYPRMWKFFDLTGLGSFNMDGPYHGDACAAINHPHHNGYHNSQWQQWKFQVQVLHELQRRNIYIPIPDWYFLNGQCATGMGYREASANLTPQQQLLLGRQYIYDGTFHKTPTMGWMTLQLVGFYSNDPQIGLEPLSENLERYELGLFQHLASGSQLTVRGNRLYDSPETKAMVTRWTSWFKKYREILTSDIIHIGRPTGRDLDAIFHVNPEGAVKGLAIIFNPTSTTIKRNYTIPLYYTGAKEAVKVREQEGESQLYSMRGKLEIELPVDIKPGGFTWFVIE